MTAYADANSLENYLGRVLTSAESDQVDAVCDTATELIDRYTGKTWQGTTVTGEQHTIYGASITLKRAPVSAISSLTLRAPVAGATVTTLVAGIDYELLNTQTGRVLLTGYNPDPVVNASWYRHGSIASVTYTVPSTVPPPVSMAANMLAASLLGTSQAVANQAQGIKRYSVGGELDVTYFDTAATTAASLPTGVRSLLDQYRRPVVFA